MKRVIRYLLIILIIFIMLILGINFYVKNTTQKFIYNNLNYKEIENQKCILVLGAAVYKDRPSPLLEDRLKKAIEIYQKDNSLKIIVSGDHGKKYYDEVNVMKKYLIDAKIPSENIFMDHAGFSTYDSIYRAKYVFKANNIIIVSQEYHLYRALYIAKKLDLNAIGVSAEKINYPGDLKREIREILARNKDFFKVIFKPKSTYVGKEIPLNLNGNLTND